MKSWRERVVEARERGKFCEEDFSAWFGCLTCPVGEGTKRLDIEEWGQSWLSMVNRVNGQDLGDIKGASGRFHGAMLHRDFATAETILDEIDDRVLSIKREGPDG